MKLLRISALAVAALLIGETGGRLMAQGGIQPLNQPAYSPYLNLFRSGAPLYQNYYGLVRPEQEFRGALNQLQQQGQGGPDQAYAPGPANAYVTGHPSLFLNTLTYFPGNNQSNSNLGGIHPSNVGAGNLGAGNLGGYNNLLGGTGNLGYGQNLNNYNNYNQNLNFGIPNNYTTPRLGTYGLPGINY